MAWFRQLTPERPRQTYAGMTTDEAYTALPKRLSFTCTARAFRLDFERSCRLFRPKAHCRPAQNLKRRLR
jgi:hypothetical protein